MTHTPLFTITDLTKVYRMGDMEVRALAGISLRVDEGEFMAIMGSSGSGKSTLMNILGCLDRPTEGRYELAGKDVSQMARDDLARIRNQTIGFIFQNFSLLSRTSAIENVELPLVYAGVYRRDRMKRAQEALEQVGLSSRMHHHPNQLSGGQQQRVAIARALVGRPRIILADEPTGNLDSATSSEIMSLLQKLNQSGMTIVMVTHEEEIAAYASRAVLLRDGRVLSDRRQAPEHRSQNRAVQP